MHGDNRELLAADLEGMEVILPEEDEWVEI